MTEKTIKKLLSVANLNQRQAAEVIGISPTQLNRWCKGKVNITVEKLADIAEKLDCEIDISFKKKSTRKLLGWHNEPKRCATCKYSNNPNSSYPCLECDRWSNYVKK